MKWRFWDNQGDPRDEHRAGDPGLDPLVQAILGRPYGASAGADPHALAAVEAAASMLSRAFASAQVQPQTAATRPIGPGLLAIIGRAFIRRGEALAIIEADPIDGLRLDVAASWDIMGAARAASWRYRANLQGPSRVSTVSRPAAAVLHPRINVEDRTPWRGRSPIEKAGLSAALVAGAEKALTGETKIPSSRIAPHPSTQKADAQELADILKKGGITAIPNSSIRPDTDMTAGAKYAPAEVKADPSAALVQLRGDAAAEVFTACGIPPALFTASSDAGLRESYRQFLFSTVQPWAAQLAEELADKLDVPGLEFDHKAMGAADIASRARGFQSLVGGGVAIDKALALSGLLARED